MTNAIPQNLVPHFILEQHRQGNAHGHFQAATLFVDLTGFTPLTEALMRHEKDGAETLAEALREIFSPLVHHVYKRAGLIPLFAGDAFTAIFPVVDQSREHTHTPHSPAIAAAQRAVSCALALQQWMAGEGQAVETRYGSFDLAVTAGLSFGEVRWGIPGQGTTRAFYFRGEAIDGCALAEHEAAVGETIADANLLRLVGERLQTEPLSGGGYAKVIDASLPEAIATKPTTAPPSTGLTLFIAQSILDLTVPAEFREVCVLFLSFQEPEDLDEMHAFIAAAMELTVTYGGIVNQLDFGDMGGYLLLLFGAPVTHEDDCERVAELLLTLRTQRWSLSWRAGVDFGTVWAGIRGGDERNEYGVAGNVVILACRLFLMAPWDEIWISQTVARKLQARYDVIDVGKKKIKGRSEPQPVYRLGDGRLAMADMTPRAALIGRSRELDQLHDWLQPIFTDNFGGVIYVDGEAGIGKSRLIRELQEKLRDQHAIYWLTCPTDALLRQSLHPLRQALQNYVGATNEETTTPPREHFDSVLDALINRLKAQGASTPHAPLAQELDRVRSVLAALLNIRWADSFYEQLDPQLRFDNTLSALKTFIKALATLHPVILHLEDSHWLDDDSRQALELLTRNMAGVPLAILATARYQDDGTPIRLTLPDDILQQTLALADLSVDGVGRYAEQILGAPLVDDSVTELARRTNGNPFFIEQLLLDLRERGQLTEETVNDETRYRLPEEASDSVPPTLNAVLMARLDRLEPPVKEVVQTAAVLGREFDVPVLAQMLIGDEGLQQRLSVAQQEQIWSELNTVRYLFRHALLRDAAYDMQLRARLRELHARAGQAIETLYPDALEPHYAGLAYHYDRAEQVDVAAHWYGLAGEVAADQYANEDAVRYLSRGLALTPEEEVEAQIGLLQKRERVHDVRGDRANQEEDLETVLHLAEKLQDRSVRAESLRRYAHFARMTGDYAKALVILPKAAEEAQQANDVAAESRAYHTWGRTLWQHGQYDEAMRHFQNALTLSRQISDWQQVGKCLYDMGNIYFYQADYQNAEKMLSRAQHAFLRIKDHVREVSCVYMYGVIQNEYGNYLSAQDYYYKALNIYRTIGYRHGEIFIYGYLGNNYFDLGDYHAAIDYHEHALAMCREVGDREGEANSLDALGITESILDNNDIAETHIRSALAIQRAIGDRRFEAYSLTHLGYVKAAVGSYDAAHRFYEQAAQIRRELGENNLLIDDLAGLAHVYLMKKNIGQALDYVNEILRWIEENGTNGIEFVIHVYLTCYQVLQAAVVDNLETPERMQVVLRTGYDLLQQRAKAIQDESLRRNFLQNVPFNRKLMEAWQKSAASLRANED